MKLYYITLNTEEEAKAISYELLEKKLAVCTNWFAISCAYVWQEDIKCGNEVVLIVKTIAQQRTAIETVIAKHIVYTNFIAEIPVDSINVSFQTWLSSVVG